MLCIATEIFMWCKSLCKLILSDLVLRQYVVTSCERACELRCLMFKVFFAPTHVVEPGNTLNCVLIGPSCTCLIVH